ncbi:MAG: NADH-quinone oxidoreductase subunit C [Dehalococcoidia bacterium]|nr:NADH-quinone oxidoreductase subunit C [Dehalococcoidia bacterium]
MTTPLAGTEIAERIKANFPEAVIQGNKTEILLNRDSIADVARFLNRTPGLDFNYLVNLTGVDYFDYLEVVYHLQSLTHNHSVVIKTRCYDRDNPSVPSVIDIWRGADFQEREVYDLLGIRFDGHPNMKRIFLWEGFRGHPLRRDYL